MSLTKIGSIGINTGIQFAGVTTVSTLKVGSGVTVSSDGDIFATGVCTATSFSGSGANLTGIDTDLVSDTSPQLGGNLDVNTKNIVFGDSSGATDDRLTFGAGTDLSIYHDGSASRIIESGTGGLIIQTSTFNLDNGAGSENLLTATENGAVELYYDNSKIFETGSDQATITGKLTINRSSNNEKLILSGSAAPYIRFQESTTNKAYMQWNDNGYIEIYNQETSKYMRVGGQGVEVMDNINFAAGNASDLKIYHNGSHSVISNDTGTLFTLADNVSFKNNANNQTLMTASVNGAVDLYHSNTKRLETQSGGVRIRDRLGVNCDPNGSHPMQVDHDEQYIIAIRNTAADSSNFPWLCHKEINSTQAFAIHINGISGDPFHVDQNGGIFLNKETATANRLGDYEEGTWTPANSTVGFTAVQGYYQKVGNYVHWNLRVAYTSNSSGVYAYVDGFPFTTVSQSHGSYQFGAYTTYSTRNVWYVLMGNNASRIYLYDGSGNQLNSAYMSGKEFRAQGWALVQ